MHIDNIDAGWIVHFCFDTLQNVVRKLNFQKTHHQIRSYWQKKWNFYERSNIFRDVMYIL